MGHQQPFVFPDTEARITVECGDHRPGTARKKRHCANTQTASLGTTEASYGAPLLTSAKVQVSHGGLQQQRPRSLFSGTDTDECQAGRPREVVLCGQRPENLTCSVPRFARTREKMMHS